MYVLEKLWRGEISPMERCVRRGSRYQLASTAFCERMEGLLSELPSDVRKRLEALSDLKSDINLMENEDFFIYGFRLGAGMVLDVIGDHKGAFRERAEGK